MFSYDKLLTLLKQQAEGNEGKTVPGGKASVASISTTAPWILKNTQAISMGLNVANSFMGTPKEYEGLKGGTTQTIDGFTDAAANVASQFGPVGLYISMGIQANKLLGGIAKKFGAGTDGMTSTDAILGSSILQMTPLGLINGFGGKRANTFLQDKYTQSQSLFSYGGTNQLFANAAMKSGKKYGTFSSGARKEANWEIDAAGRRQNLLKYLIKDRDIANESMAGSTDIYNTGYANELMGGYQPLMAAKQGAKINAKALSKAKRVASKMRATNKMKPVEELKQGGSFEWDISMFLDGGKNKTLSEVKEKKNDFKVPDFLTLDEEGNYVSKYYLDDDLAEDLTWKQPKEFRKLYKLWEEDGGKFKYVPKKKWNDLWYEKNKNYILLQALISADSPLYYDVTPDGNVARPTGEYDEETGKELYETPDGELYTMKQGGTIIPEGALHKNLNHLGEVNPDLKGEVTTKGIPIISEEGGQIVQHAEIESGEIIFQKSITEKLEELYKKYNEEGTTESEKDELAIKAGKIITCEIMKHTDDKVGLINPEENEEVNT